MLGVGRVQIEHRDLVVVLEIADPRHKVFEEHDALDEEEEAEEDDPDVLVGAVVVCGTDPVSAILVPLVAGGPDATDREDKVRHEAHPDEEVEKVHQTTEPPCVSFSLPHYSATDQQTNKRERLLETVIHLSTITLDNSRGAPPYTPGRS